MLHISGNSPSLLMDSISTMARGWIRRSIYFRECGKPASWCRGRSWLGISDSRCSYRSLCRLSSYIQYPWRFRILKFLQLWSGCEVLLLSQFRIMYSEGGSTTLLHLFVGMWCPGYVVGRFLNITHSPITKFNVPDMHRAARLHTTTFHPKMRSKSSKNPILTRKAPVAERL